MDIELDWFHRNVKSMNDSDIELFARDYFLKCMPKGHVEIMGIPDTKTCMDWLLTDYGLYLLNKVERGNVGC